MGLHYGFWFIFLLLLDQDHYTVNYYTHVCPIIGYSPSNEMFGATRLDGTHWSNRALLKHLVILP